MKEKTKKGISILITAWKTQDFIEECLDSVSNQSYFKDNDEYEILVGVDGCKQTLNKLLDIKHKYKNLSIYMINDNVGTYVTTNTLIDKSKYEYIIRFDSDDIMKNDMVKKLFDNIQNADGIRYKSEKSKKTEHGSVFFKRKIFDMFGGYMDWVCGADTELLYRINNHVKIKRLDDVLYFKRIHSNALTQIYKQGSDTRKKLLKIVKNNNYDQIIKINKKTATCERY